MSSPVVWLPREFEDLGGLPPGMKIEFIAPDAVPAERDGVAFVLPGDGWGESLGDVLATLPDLKVVQTLSAGVDYIRRHVPAGVTLCNGREINTPSTAELAVTLTLASLRQIPEFVRLQDDGDWPDAWTDSLVDKRVLIVGYGSIGQAIEARLLPFEAAVVPVARTAREGVHGLDELPALLPDADVVILILPLTTESRGLVDAAFLDAMKPGSLLVNVARGPVVDTEALTDACKRGSIRAALDVTDPEPLPRDHPLWSMPNVLITPHVGGNTFAWKARVRSLIQRQLTSFVAGEPLVNVVAGEY